MNALLAACDFKMHELRYFIGAGIHRIKIEMQSL